MKNLDRQKLEKLLEVHSPVELQDAHIQIFNKAYSMESENLSSPDLDSIELLDQYSIEIILSVEDKRLRWKELLEQVGDAIMDQYRSAETADSGGYILPSKLPRLLLDKVVHEAAQTNVKIIEGNRYRSYDDQHFMITEMINNADEHGNRFNEQSKVHLLWHNCPYTREILIIDQGTAHFDIDRAYNERRTLSRAFGKDDYSGLDLLAWNSAYNQFFDVNDQGQKIGTLLKIGLDPVNQPKKLTEACGYIGHKILS